jgi:tetratricopeptide (TPR) repeat protein
VLAHAYAEAGDIPAARRHLEAAMELRTERHEEGLREFCLVSQMIVDVMTADLDAAAVAAEEVVHGRFGAAGWLGSTARFVLGQVMLERGDVGGARSWTDEACTLSESLGETAEAATFHLDLVSLEAAAGRLDAAEAHFLTALELLAEKERGTDLRLLSARSDLAMSGGDPTRAAELADAALARATELSMAVDRCHCLRRLGDARLAAGNPELALSTFQMLVARAGAAPYPCRVAEGHEGAAAAADALGRVRAAHRHLAAAEEIRRRTGTRRVGRPWIETHLARLEDEAGERQLSESGR